MNDANTNSQFYELTDDEEDVTSNTSKSQQHNDSVAADLQMETPPQKEDQQLWAIDDDTLFYPLGLLAHGNAGGKCVFVTWSADYLLNFVFKMSTQGGQEQQGPKLTKVRLAIEADDEICDILITELNTLLLMRSGRIYYFSSVKSIHPVGWLNCGVRCISTAQAGFSLIRVHANNSITLEIYRDVLRLGKGDSTLLKRYDISFDSNLFNCQWRDERFTLLTQVVADEEQLPFMQHLIGGTCALHVQQELHFFTVSGHVFVLIVDGTASTPDSYHIQLLCSYASDVAFVRLLPSRQMCLVFLDCGSIDIWYASNRMHGLRRTTHHTGTQYTHCQFALATECFYYTNERHVAQLQFRYDDEQDTVVVREAFKGIPGIVACVWSVSMRQLVCLSCNNIFYPLTFEDDSTVERTAAFAELNELYELTPARVTQMLHKAHVAEELARMPQQLHAAIERQYVRQQLLRVSRKTHLYKRLCTASLEYAPGMPPLHANLSPDSLLLHASNRSSDNTSCALIRLHITRSHEIFALANWQLHVTESTGMAYLLHLPTEPHQLKAPIFVVVPLSRREAHELLPTFRLQLLCFLNGGDSDPTEQLVITLPCIVPTTTARTYAQLFSPVSGLLPSGVDGTAHSLRHLVAYFKRRNSKPGKSLQPTADTVIKPQTYSCSLDLASSTLSSTAQFFEAPPLSGQQEFTLYFLGGAPLRVISANAHCSRLRLECVDAIALYYAKLCLSKQFAGKAAASKSASTLLQYQCAVEHCYGTLQRDAEAPTEMDEQERCSTRSQHFETLLRIYAKLRSN